MLRVWNMTLVILTFFLTIFGTFMTRSGVVQSVHAFGEDPQLAMLFTIFMVVILVFSFGLVIYRLPLLKSRNELDSWASREAAFLANNWILLFSAFFVLFATMYPTLSEAIRGERLTVGPPFFNKWMLPIGLILLLLTGVGPLLAWRKSTIANMVHQFLWPATAAVVTGGALVAAGVRVWASGICFALCAWVVVAIAQEFIRGAGVRQQTTGTDLFTAFVGIFGRSRRRYSGYIVHLGIVVMFFGFAGEGFKNEAQVDVQPGQETTVGAFTVRHDSLQVTADAQKQMITGHVTIFEGGREIGTMTPAKWYYEKRPQEPTTEVAIRRAVGEDLYIVLGGFDVASQKASYTITVNPLVNWVWLGLGVMVVGCIFSMLPERMFAVAVARLPQGAATTSMLGLLLLLHPFQVQAQSGTAHNVSEKPKSALYQSLEGEIMCTCSCRRPLNDCPMEPNCHGLDEQRPKLAKFLAAGMNRDEVLAAFVADYGSQEILMRPIDKGFHRMLWLFPYLLGGTAAVGVAVVARRWVRPSVEPPAPPRAPGDQLLNERLDDELRDLD